MFWAKKIYRRQRHARTGCPMHNIIWEPHQMEKVGRFLVSRGENTCAPSAG